MRCKVRYVTKLANGTLATRDQEVATTGPRLRLGRGTDNDVFLKDLAVAYRHADIVVRDFDIIVEAQAGSTLLFDEVPVGRGVLAPGTVVGIGPFRLTLEPPEPDFDLVLGIEAPAAASAPAIPREALQVRGGMLGRRPLSWVLLLLVSALGLALPIAAHWSYAERPVTVADGRAGDGPAATLFAGFDHLWDTGELSDPHKFLEQRCEACHVRAFEPIRDETCGGCHGDVRHHFNDRARFGAATLRAAGHEPARCSACHAEHQGADGAVPSQQALCVGCHQGLTTLAAGTDLGNVGDFGTDHPQFRPSVVVDEGRTARLEIGGATPLEESSGLRFNHLCHLGLKPELPAAATAAERRCYSPDGLLAAKAYPAGAAATGPEGGRRFQMDGILEVDFPNPAQPLRARLTCASCHLPDAGGAVMRPVDMEQHCGYCHSLSFDGDDPARVLPHGKPDEVAAVLEDYYVARMAQEATTVRAGPTGQRQRPGAASVRKQAEAIEAAAPPALRQRAAGRLEAVFKDDGLSTCGYCHVTTVRQEGAQPVYGIRRVQVQRVWEPKARFDHGSHTAVTCAHCHEAERSSASADVLMPGIATCRACHQGEAAAAAVPSTCTMCHVYHQERGTCPIVPGAAACPPPGSLAGVLPH